MEKTKRLTGMTIKRFIYERGSFSKILAMAALLLAAINTGAVQFTKLFDFNVTNGACPFAGLVLSGNTLYGTTLVGNTSVNASGVTDGTGTIFRINTDGKGFTTLYYFPTNCNAFFPVSDLALSSNILYGTTLFGDTVWGTVFRINTDGTDFTVLHGFYDSNNMADGMKPAAGLVLCSNTLYGTTCEGGLWNDFPESSGTIFKVNTDGTGFANLYRFSALSFNEETNSDGAYPRASLVLSGNTLYGTAPAGGSGSGGNEGGAGCGVIFKINTDGTGFNVLHSFSSASYPNFVNSDGANPRGRLVLSGNILYGTAIIGGSYGNGTIFKINTDGTGFTNLFNFNGNNGVNPVGDLVLSGNILYGMTFAGGAGVGMVFAINTDGAGFTNLYSFPWDGLGDAPNGAYPYAGLVLSGNTLYGTASAGGTEDAGTVFALTLSGIPIPLNIQLIGTNVVLSWSDPAFYLQTAPLVSGVYTNVPGATSPYTNAVTGSEIFFRLRAD